MSKDIKQAEKTKTFLYRNLDLSLRETARKLVGDSRNNRLKLHLKKRRNTLKTPKSMTLLSPGLPEINPVRKLTNSSQL